VPVNWFDPGPVQAKFTEADIRAMDVGRRQLKTEWRKTLYAPVQPDDNWRMILPFANTYENAFASMCELSHHPHRAENDRLIIFLNDTEGDQEAPAEAVEWIEKVGRPVAMKDFLAISFALDYDREGGNPMKPQTEIGALRRTAKPYGESAPTAQTRKAADSLAEQCVNFLNAMTCYSSADSIVAMPPSDPSRSFNLPRYMANRIAEVRGCENLSEHVTGKPRNSIKGVPLAQKLDTLLGTIEVKDGVFTDKRVLLLDDLYQSGISMNYCGLLLLQTGAKKIFGLACEKTCRNDDNVGGDT
jgi:hypothetical protein